MSVTSLPFATFTAAVLAAYYGLARGRRAQNRWLLAASYVFYAFCDWRFPLLLAALTLAHYLCARRLHVLRPGGRAWLSAAIVADVLVLVAVREAGPLPVIGLSFYTMQAISYLADVRSGVLRGDLDLESFALYLAWFPRLLAGPIERASAFLPRLRAAVVVDDAVLAVCVSRIVEGLVRKLVLADSLAALAPTVRLEHPERYPAGILAWTLVAAVFSLYNDFAGYTQIVRGVSGLFGIELGPNFVQPFFSRSFTEFWTRWHVSLSFWLRDYIYLPLSRALLRRDPRPRSVPAAVLPPFVAMLASGFWHGGSSGMLVWGALHGVFLSSERLWTFVRPGRRGPRPPWVQGLQMLAVFVLGVLAMVPFRTSLSVALVYWPRLFQAGGWELPDARLVLLVGATLAIDAVQFRARDELVFLRWPRLVRVPLAAAALAAAWVLADRRPPPFVYQGF